MTITTATGTCVSVSAATPATHDEAGFAALAYTQVGELETLGELVVEFAAASFTNLCSGKTRVLKGEEKYSPVEIGVGLDRDDAGQAIMTTARQSLVARVAVRIADADGTVVFFQALVMGEKITGGDGPNDVRRGAYTLGVYLPPDADPVVQTSAGALPPTLDSIAAFQSPTNSRAYFDLPYGTGQSWNEAANGGELQRQAFDLEVPAGTPPAGGWPAVIYLHPAGDTKAVPAASSVDVNIKTPALSTYGVAFISGWHRNPKTNYNWDGANGIAVTDAGLLIQQVRALATALNLNPNAILVVGSSKGNDYLTATYSGELANPAADTYAGRQSSIPSAGWSINAQVYYDSAKWATAFVPPANQAAFLAAEPSIPALPNAAELAATCPLACLIPLVMVHESAYVQSPNIDAVTNIHYSGNGLKLRQVYEGRGQGDRVCTWASESTAEGRMGQALEWWRHLRSGCTVREAAAITRAKWRQAGLWYARNDLSGMSQNSDGSGAIAVDNVVGGIVDGSYGLANRAAVAGSLGYPLGQPGGTSLKPTLRAKGNGQYCIRFDGSNDKLQSAFASNGTPTFRAFADVVLTNYISATTSTLQIGVGTTETTMASKDVSLFVAQNPAVAAMGASDLMIYTLFAQELSGVAYPSLLP